MLQPTQYFHPREVIALQRATSYSTLADIAIRQAKRMGEASASLPGIACGPISTGGLGDKMLNIARFEEVVNHFVAAKHGNFFSQIPFEESLWRVQEHRGEKPGITHPAGAGNPLLEEFYRPLFMSRHIGALYFIKGWQSSIGATWEHDLAVELGITRCFLDDDFRVNVVVSGPAT